MIIEVDKSQVRGVQFMLSELKNAAPILLSTALNKTASNSKAEMGRQAYKELNLKKARINKDLSIERATYKKLSAKAIAKGVPVGLIQFMSKPKKKDIGIKVAVKRGGNPKTIIRGFVQNKKGTLHLFQREYRGAVKPFNPKTKYGMLPRKYRYDIDRLTGPRIEDIIAEPAIMRKISQYAESQWSKNVNAAMKRVLDRF